MAQNLLERLIAGVAALHPRPEGPVPFGVDRLSTVQQEDYRALYDLLLRYYENTGLYAEVLRELQQQEVWHPAMKGLRNPAKRLVDFYVMHAWPGPLSEALPTEQIPAAIRPAILQVWDWGNFKQLHKRWARWLSIFGDNYVKVVTGDDRTKVFHQLLDPRIVTEFEADDRDYALLVRLDTEHTRERAGIEGFETYVRTELWDKASQTLTIWETDRWRSLEELERLPEKTQRTFRELGLTFIPIVHAPFADTGLGRGMGAYTLLLDKIDEVDRAATRLHQILFRFGKPTIAVRANARDASGRPAPAPTFGTRRGQAAGTTALGDDEVLYLPGESEVEFLIAKIDYQAALAIVEAAAEELVRDAPELMQAEIAKLGDRLASRSARTLLDPAIKKVKEFRANLEDSLIRADQMALTIGQYHGLFEGLGTYEDGDFAHRFPTRPVIPLTELEESEVQQNQGQAATYWAEVGIKRERIAERIGFKPSDVDDHPTPVPGTGTPTNAAVPRAPTGVPERTDPS